MSFYGLLSGVASRTWTSVATKWSPLSPMATFAVRCKSTLKTNKSVAKRFRVRGNGSLKRNKSGCSHNTGYKTRSRKNRLGQSDSISQKTIEQRMKRLMGVNVN